MLTDFGIAHLNSMTGITARGMAIGTPAYISPEQGMGKMVGPQSDQYSLAVMTYQMLAGRSALYRRLAVPGHAAREQRAAITDNIESRPADWHWPGGRESSQQESDRSLHDVRRFRRRARRRGGELSAAPSPTAPTLAGGETIAASMSIPLPQGSAASVGLGVPSQPTMRPEPGVQSPLQSAIASVSSCPVRCPSAAQRPPRPWRVPAPDKSKKMLIIAAVGAAVVILAAGLGLKAIAGSGTARAHDPRL